MIFSQEVKKRKRKENPTRTMFKNRTTLTEVFSSSVKTVIEINLHKFSDILREIARFCDFFRELYFVFGRP